MILYNNKIANRLLTALFAAAVLILPLYAAGQALPPVEGRRANTAYAPALPARRARPA